MLLTYIYDMFLKQNNETPLRHFRRKVFVLIWIRKDTKCGLRMQIEPCEENKKIKARPKMKNSVEALSFTNQKFLIHINSSITGNI